MLLIGAVILGFLCLLGFTGGGPIVQVQVSPLPTDPDSTPFTGLDAVPRSVHKEPARVGRVMGFTLGMLRVSIEPVWISSGEVFPDTHGWSSC